MRRPESTAEGGVPGARGHKRGRKTWRPAGLALPVALYLGAVLLPVQFRIGPLLMTAPRLVLLILIVPALWHWRRGGRGRIHPTDAALAAFAVWAGAALSVTSADMAVQNAGSTGIELLGGYLIGRAYIRDAEDFAALCRALTLAVALMVPLALFEAIAGWPPVLALLRSLPFISTPDLVDHPRRLGLHRAQGVFPHPILFGTFCASVFGLCLIGLRDRLGNRSRVALAALVAAGTFLSLSSGPILTIALVLFLSGWATIFDADRRRWLWLLAGIALAYLVVDLASNRGPLRVFMSYATFSAQTAYYREAIYHWGLVNLSQHPLFGIGLNDWRRPGWMVSPSMDSFWLVVAVRYGLPGIGLMALALGAALWSVARRPLDPDTARWTLRRAWMFTIVALIFTLATVDLWTNVFSYFFFLIGSGMWLTDARATSAAPTPQRAARRPAAPLLRRPPAQPPGHPADAANPSPYRRFGASASRGAPE